MYIYALGGVDDTGAALGTFEFLTVTVAADGSHTVGSWTQGSADGGVTDNTFNPKYNLGGYTVDSFVLPALGDTETWIYAGPGEGGAGTGVTRFQSAEVQAGGQLTAWGTASNQSKARSGFRAW